MGCGLEVLGYHAITHLDHVLIEGSMEGSALSEMSCSSPLSLDERAFMVPVHPFTVPALPGGQLCLPLTRHPVFGDPCAGACAGGGEHGRRRSQSVGHSGAAAPPSSAAHLALRGLSTG